MAAADVRRYLSEDLYFNIRRAERATVGHTEMGRDTRLAHAYALAGDSMRSWYPFRHGDACRCSCGFDGHYDAIPTGSVMIEDAVWRDGDGWKCEGCYRG